MKSKIWNLFVLINYCGQRISYSFFTEKAVVNVILFELSFITSGILIGILALIGVENPIFAAIIGLAFVLVIWKLFENKVQNGIEFFNLEYYYSNISVFKRTLFFLFAICLFAFSFLFMLYSIGFVVSFGKSLGIASQR